MKKILRKIQAFYTMKKTFFSSFTITENSVIQRRKASPVKPQRCFHGDTASAAPAGGYRLSLNSEPARISIEPTCHQGILLKFFDDIGLFNFNFI